MAKTKGGSSKKQQKRGIDFKKIKRKLGRKLPPPKNATSTEIKSKAIVLPEQTVASEKAGLAMSKKGFTLKELLQRTSHHNAKVRRDALMGMRDLFHNHPEELKLHRYAVIEKLRERISDDDRTVRENLYQLLDSVILPGCKEDNQGPFVSLVMAYIFNAMTHLAIEVRLMAFKFFDLVVEYYPPSFFSYAEKILQNYKDILLKNQFHLQDKGKLKNALTGLVHCLSLLPSEKGEINLLEKNVTDRKILHAFEPEVPTVSAEYSIIIKKLKDLVPVLVNCFQDFLPLLHNSLDAQSFDCMLSILQSINLAVKFFIHGIQLGDPESQHLDQRVSSVLLKKLLVGFPRNPIHHLSEKDNDRYVTLNIVITEIFMALREWICPPADLLQKFLAFIEYVLLEKSSSNVQSSKAVREKQMLKLIPFIPKLVSEVVGDWKSRLLQAFTKTFLDSTPELDGTSEPLVLTKTIQDSTPEPLVKLACLAAIGKIIFREDLLYLDVSDSDLLDNQIIWIKKLPQLLIMLGNKQQSSSKVVLHLLLRLGQHSLMNTIPGLEHEIQHSLHEFYSTDQGGGNVCYGPFITLANDCQELSICCLYYFSQLDSTLLKSITSCCLCPELNAFMLFRIIEVVHSAYKAGHIRIADHISFLITLALRFKVLPENMCPTIETDVKISNHGTFKSVTSAVCSCLSQMGDNSLVFMILERVILEQLSLKPPLHNACAMLRMLIVLDSKPTRLSEQSIASLSNVLSGYLIDVAHCVPEDNGDESISSIDEQTKRYYLLPCFFLFDRSHKLMHLVLNMMELLITENCSSPPSGDHIRYARSPASRINAIVSILLSMQSDATVQRILSLSKVEIERISQNICSLQSSEDINLAIEERHLIKRAFGRLKTLMSSCPWKTQTL